MVTEAAKEGRDHGSQYEYCSGRYKIDDLLGLKNSKLEKNVERENEKKSHKQSFQNY